MGKEYFIILKITQDPKNMKRNLYLQKNKIMEKRLEYQD